MPTGTVIDRNYLREVAQGVSDYNDPRLGEGMYKLYNNFAKKYGQSDLDRYIEMQTQLTNSLGTSNRANTGLANEQTIAANTALRNANIADVGRLGEGASSTYRNANPELYSGLSQFSAAAGNQLTADQAALARGGQLTAEEIRNSQQAAREGWGARGLINSNGAVAQEILNRQNAVQAREAIARQNYNQSMQNAYAGNQAQTANRFDPFNAILGSQYGMQTNNAGSNANLFNQGTSFSSGQQGNQYVQNTFNPFNQYANDVYGSNFNAANARVISDANNAAALAGAQNQAGGQLAQNFLNTLFNVGRSNNWWGG